MCRVEGLCPQAQKDEAETDNNRDDADVVPDIVMMYAASAEAISTFHLPSGKDYLDSSAFTNVDADDFGTVGGASFFHSMELFLEITINILLQNLNFIVTVGMKF